MRRMLNKKRKIKADCDVKVFKYAEWKEFVMAAMSSNPRRIHQLGVTRKTSKVTHLSYEVITLFWEIWDTFSMKFC